MIRDLVFLAVSLFTWGVAESMFLFFQPIYLKELGADPIRIGAILGGFGLMMVSSHIPAGYLADRIGRKPVLVSAWVIGLVAAWIMALAPSLPVFIAGLFLYGFTMFVLSPLNSYVTAARGKLSVGRAITLISASYNLGAVLGPWLGGQVGEQFGLRQNYIIAGFLIMVSTLVILFLRPQPVERVSRTDSANGWLRTSRYWLYVGAIFLATFAMYLAQPLAPNFLVEQRSLTLGQTGLLYSITSFGVVLLNLVLGSFPARVGFLVGQAAVGVYALILWKVTGLPWYVLAFLLLGGYKAARNLGIAQVRELVPQAKIGLAYGLTETFGGTAVILAPLLAGYLYTQQPSWMFALSAGLISISLLVSARLSPAPQVTLEQTPPISSSTPSLPPEGGT
jgi:MFS family permease